MADYEVFASLRAVAYVQSGETDRTFGGGVRPQTSWRNPYFATTPDWARKVFDNLSEFLARPTFWNGILVGDGQGPSRDPVTGEWVNPLPPMPVVGNNPTQTAVSLQSDDWKITNPPRGWRLDRSGWASFDWAQANVINSRTRWLRFQFQGSKADIYAGTLTDGADTGGHVSIRDDGLMSVPRILTSSIANLSTAGVLRDLWLNSTVKVASTGIITAPDMYARGQQVSIEGHLHTAAENAAAAAAVAAHVAASDPHTQYLKESDASSTYSTPSSVASAIATHAAASDPHPTYLTQTEGETLFARRGGYSGVEGGVVSGTTDGSGDLTVFHGIGSTPGVITVTLDNGTTFGGAWANPAIHSRNSSSFKVRLYESYDETVHGNFADPDGDNIWAGLSVTLHWIALW